METQELENMAAKQTTPTTSKDDVEDELVFMTAHNNPEEAEKFIKSIVTLVDKFMADITGYDRYKQEEAYTEFVRKYVKELKNLDDYFKDTSPSTILKIIDDKMCEYIRKPPLDPQGIKTRTSEENIPTGHHALQQLAHEQPSPTLDDAGQAAVVQLFANLQFAHEYSAKVAKAVTKLGAVTTPSQFCFIMRKAVRPIIQLQVPPQLSSPANWNFAKERLIEEELVEEEGSNQMLPQPFHPILAEIDEKHLTRCATMAVHWLIRKAGFKTNISQNKVADKFRVAPKKLHEAITRRKYDPG